MKHRSSMSNEIKQRIVAMIMDGFRREGDKFLSIRALAMKMECSPMTVIRAVRELVDEGVLSARPKSGLYIAKKPERYSQANRYTALKTLYFFYYPTAIQMDSYHADIYQYLSREAEWKHWNIRLGNLVETTLFQQAVADPNAAGIIFQANPRYVDLDLDRGRIKNRPLVAYGMAPAAYPGVSSVGLDNYQGGWELAEYLLERNCHDIIFIQLAASEVKNIHSRSFLERFHGAEDCLRSRGLSFQAILPWSVNGQVEAVLEELRRARAERRRPVLIVTNCSMAMEIFQIAQECGFRIPQDFGIVSFVRRKAEEWKCPITCMDFSHQEMAQAIARLLLLPEFYEHDTRILLKMSLTEEGSLPGYSS